MTEAPTNSSVSSNRSADQAKIAGFMAHLFSSKNAKMTGYPAIVVDQPRLLEHKLIYFLDGGLPNLQVVSDFDYTMSKFQHNGVQMPITHGVLYSCSELPSPIKQKWKETLEFYLPIERDMNMPETDKLPYMVNFWNTAHDLLIKAKLNRSATDSLVQRCSIVLREHVDNFLRMLEKHNIPVMVFSAGVGDVIEGVLKQADRFTDNVRVVSNFMEFDSQGNLTNFRKPLIHLLNKTMRTVTGFQNVSKFTSTTRVLLLGDSLVDVRMVDEHDLPANAFLRIGFLNRLSEDNLVKYRSVFDIVLIDDDSFRIPLMLLELLLSNQTADETSNILSTK